MAIIVGSIVDFQALGRQREPNKQDASRARSSRPNYDCSLIELMWSERWIHLVPVCANDPVLMRAEPRDALLIVAVCMCELDVRIFLNKFTRRDVMFFLR